jgi:hypothetical protein
MTRNTDIDHFLHVDLLVQDGDAPKFEERVAEFLKEGGFGRIVQEGDDDELKSFSGKELVLGLKSTRPLPLLYTPSVAVPGAPAPSTKGSLSVFRYVHVWRVPQLTDVNLVRLMRLCAADKLYRELDALVVDESQDFAVRIDLPQGGDNQGVFLRSIDRFPSFDLGRYVFDIGLLLPKLYAERDIVSFRQFQSVTGTINSVIGFWHVPGDYAGSGDLKAQFQHDRTLPKDLRIDPSAPPPLELPAAASFVEALASYLSPDQIKAMEMRS